MPGLNEIPAIELLKNHQVALQGGNLPDIAKTGVRLGRQYLRDQDFGACLQTCEQLLAKLGEATPAEVFFLKAYSSEKEGDLEVAMSAYQEARVRFRKMSETPPNLLTASHNLAMIYLQTKDIPKYLELELDAYRLALSMGKKRQIFLLGYSLGAFFQQTGQPDQAKSLLSMSYQLGLSESYAEVGKLEFFMRENDLL